MRYFLVAASLMLPAQSFALSCQEPSIEYSYAQAAKSEDVYQLATGRLAFDPSLLPRSTVNMDLPAKITRIPATITGKAFIGSGFDQDFTAPVDLVVRCIQSWCPTLSNEKEYLVFMKEAETAYELAIAPCSGVVFPDPTPEILGQVLACFESGTCSDEIKPGGAD